MRRALLCSLNLLLAGCAAAQPLPKDSTAARAAVLEAIGRPQCTADAQCRSLGLGSRPCGGPEQYLAYSTLNADPQRLEALAAAHREARRAENQASGRKGICQVLPDPGAHCDVAQGLCVSGSPGR